LRVTEADASAALRVVIGEPVIPARARLRFGPGRTCEQIARMLDRAIAGAQAAGLDPRLLVVADGGAQAAEDIIRVRRKAHGVADWIHSPTCHVRITLRPAGLLATSHQPEPPAPPAPAAATPVPALVAAGSRGESARVVRDALSEVIDPDLGVNIVDLGFVRAVAVQERTAVITMTLTSAACPLTGVMENQIRAELAAVDGIDDFRVDWQWVPAWRPADLTDSGREQLRAIGFAL
ncbi:MAG TPA: iron-sulfur cluster assembly protein, partial [Trebonia sp.]|nr:iron-sulfur cluster assembly protein [Trebonia sp.]